MTSRESLPHGSMPVSHICLLSCAALRWRSTEMKAGTDADISTWLVFSQRQSEIRARSGASGEYRTQKKKILALARSSGPPVCTARINTEQRRRWIYLRAQWWMCFPTCGRYLYLYLSICSGASISVEVRKKTPPQNPLRIYYSSLSEPSWLNIRNEILVYFMCDRCWISCIKSRQFIRDLFQKLGAALVHSSIN